MKDNLALLLASTMIPKGSFKVAFTLMHFMQ